MITNFAIDEVPYFFRMAKEKTSKDKEAGTIGCQFRTKSVDEGYTLLACAVIKKAYLENDTEWLKSEWGQLMKDLAFRYVGK